MLSVSEYSTDRVAWLPDRDAGLGAIYRANSSPDIPDAPAELTAAARHLCVFADLAYYLESKADVTNSGRARYKSRRSRAPPACLECSLVLRMGAFRFSELRACAQCTQESPV